MIFGRIRTWSDEGIMGVLAVHIALFFVFVLIISFVSLSIEERFVSWISGAGEIQIITVLVLMLAFYITVEIGLLLLLMGPYVRILDHPWAQREWIAYVFIAGTLIATLTSPLTFGSFALVLPGLPELIVFVVFPLVSAKAIKADEGAGS